MKILTQNEWVEITSMVGVQVEQKNLGISIVKCIPLIRLIADFLFKQTHA